MKVAAKFSKFVPTVSMGALMLGLLIGCGGSKSSESGSDVSEAQSSQPKGSEPTLSVCKDPKWAANYSDGRFCSFKKSQETYFNAKATDRSTENGQSFAQQGRTPGEAIREALALCNARTSATGYGGTCTM